MESDNSNYQSLSYAVKKLLRVHCNTQNYVISLET